VSWGWPWGLVTVAGVIYAVRTANRSGAQVVAGLPRRLQSHRPASVRGFPGVVGATAVVLASIAS
jgi:hypothetical protein